jgi:Ca2+-binding RTX toxin-like protein
MITSRISRLGGRNGRAAADPLQPADPALSGLFRADAAAPRPQEAPPQANDDAYTTNDATVVTGNLLTNDTPGDVPLAVTAVNGSSFAVDREIILPSGARLRVNSDGSFTYNPNGAFNSLPTTNNVFTYTVAGGDTASVTITVEDPPNPNMGTNNPETINGSSGDDVMLGLGGDDILNGFGGNDSLDGGTGVDQMNGGTGNDIYFIDNGGDTITELSGEGYDIATSTVNYTLAAGVYLEELNAPSGSTTALQLTGNELDNIIRGSNGGDTLTGGAGNDTLYANLGQDMLVGGTGDDIYYLNAHYQQSLSYDLVTEAVGGGYDIAYVTEGPFVGEYRYSLNAGAEVELIAPDSIAITIGVDFTGNEFSQELRGGAGNDTLKGGGGEDVMIGYGGNDTYRVDSTGDVVVEAVNAGIDTILTSIDYVLGSDLENLSVAGGGGPFTLVGNGLNNFITGGVFGDLIIAGGGDDNLSGNSGNDSMYGEAGNDLLNGGIGADLMDGGTGNDIYLVDEAGDIVIESFEAGQTPNNGDWIRTQISYTLAEDQYIEKLTAEHTNATVNLTGNSRAQSIGGNDGNNILIGLGGDDILDGGAGTDTTDGGFGDDSHYVRQSTDIVIERAGEGRDTVYTDISYVLTAGAYVEAMAPLTPALELNINMTGNSFAQEIYGTNGANTLNGGGGADYMAGGGGNDTYFINGGNEVIVENLNGGRDVVYTAVSYTLTAGSHVEALSADSIVATTSINLTGNELNNEIYGNNGANMLNGGGGGDYLVGWGGDDTYLIFSGSEIIVENQNGGRDVVYTTVSYALAAGTYVEALSTSSIAGTNAINLTGNSFNNEIYGNNGANTLNGGGGGDYLVGWGGDDTYLIFSGAEIIIENAGGGRDVVYTAISYGLAAGTQVEVLSTDSIVGTSAINLTGNELNNEIYGNNGANMLNGGGGAGDYLVGWGGDDTYLVFTGGEIVIENAGGGRDVIYSSISYTLAAGSFVEVLSTDSIGGTSGISLTGNELGQEVYGNNGANTLNGGAGGDYMAGFGGADSFAFTTALGSGNVDHLADFSAVDDTILLENAVFTGLANGALPATAFVAGAAAADADDRIVYNSATGQIFFDADGNGAGAQVLFATVNAGTVLTASDFMVT